MVDKDEKIKIDVTNIDDSNYCSIQLGRCVYGQQECALCLIETTGMLSTLL